METPQPPQVSVSGSIIIQGKLIAPSGPSIESAPPVMPVEPWRKKLDYTGIGTIALAIATFILASLAYCSLQDMRTAIGDGQEAFQLSERAFVVPSIEIKQPGPSEEYPMLVVPVFTNEGNTQTVQLGIWLESNGLFRQGVYPSRLDPKTATHNGLWLGPKQRVTVRGFAWVIPREIIDTYLRSISFPSKSPSWLLYREAFDYFDVFKKYHIQRFCYAIWQNPVITGKGQFDYSECTGASENCADAECWRR